MCTKSVVINDLKIKMKKINVGILGHRDDKCFYLARVTSYAEILKAIHDRLGSQYSILGTTYQG